MKLHYRHLPLASWHHVYICMCINEAKFKLQTKLTRSTSLPMTTVCWHWYKWAVMAWRMNDGVKHWLLVSNTVSVSCTQHTTLLKETQDLYLHGQVTISPDGYHAAADAASATLQPCCGALHGVSVDVRTGWRKKTGPPAILSHCNYPENSMTELRGNWWTYNIICWTQSLTFLFKNFIA